MTRPVRRSPFFQSFLEGRSDANIRFGDLRSLLLRLGFTERVSGSHHIFRKAGVPDKINLQSQGGQVKPYQARQVRSIIIRYQLEELG